MALPPWRMGQGCVIRPLEGRAAGRVAGRNSIRIGVRVRVSIKVSLGGGLELQRRLDGDWF